MNDIYYIDGEFFPADEARIPVKDLLVLRGYGIFDFTRTYNRKPFRLEAHIDRLFYSASQIEMDIDYTREELIAIVQETVSRNSHHDESFIRILVTGGDTADTVTPVGGVRLMVLVTPAKGFPEHCYTDGVKVITVNDPRYLPGVKSLAYIPAIRATKKANAQGAIEALYTDNGYVREGTTSNLFAFFGERVVTPGQKILAGITRQVILELIEDVYPFEIRELTLDELSQADEVFIVSTVDEVIPVVKVNDTVIGNGKPGQQTRQVMKLFREYTQST